MSTAESVSATIDATRSCTIQINNMSNFYNLINPQFYMEYGYCYKNPPPLISSRNTGVCAFAKTSNTVCGAVGVLTYDLFQMKNRVCTERIAILFNVPYNYSLFDNIYGVGGFVTDCKCDNALYNEMYYGSDGSFTRGKAKDGGITYNSQSVEIGATMSNKYKAIIKVNITDRLGAKHF